MKIIKGKRKSLEVKAAQLIGEKIRQLAKDKEKIVFAVPGGNSIVSILKLLKTQKIPWHKVHLFMVDEVLLPLNHPKSNYGQAYSILLEYLTKQYKMPKENLHPYDFFNFPPEQGTEAYKNELREISHHFDLVLLSSGEDGHIGSLFPNYSIKDTSDSYIYIDNSPKLPKKRISASAKLLSKSHSSILLFFGGTKKQAYKNFLNKEFSVLDCPAKIVSNIEESYVFTDI